MSNENKQPDGRAAFSKWYESPSRKTGDDLCSTNYAGELDEAISEHAFMAGIAYARATQQATKGEPDAIQKFIDAQQPLDPECARVLNENFWDLIDNGPQTNPSPVAGSAGQAPVAWQFRVAMEGFEPTEWKECTDSQAAHMAEHGETYETRALYAAPTAPSLTTDAGAVTDAKILGEFEKRCISMPMRDDFGTPTLDGVRVLEGVRALLAAHPTEQRMSDAARPEPGTTEYGSWINSSAKEASQRFREHSDRFKWLCAFEQALYAARKAEIERSGGGN